MKELMVVVERAVRPVRAGARRKLRMREELLAHLTSIFEEERARRGDERVARDEAIRRFGEPSALTRGLQECLTRGDRLTYFVERWIGWRAKESTVRYVFRLAATVFVLLVAFALAMVAMWLTERLVKQGGIQELPLLLLNLAVLVGMATGAVFLLGLLYVKIRDALWGGSDISRLLIRASAYGVLFGLVVLAAVFGMLLYFGMLLVPSGGLELCLEILWPWWYVLALVSPLVPALYGRMHGPTEVRHAEWACLDLEG